MENGYVGFHNESKLPFKKGDVVTIPAGVTVRTLHPSRNEYVTKRKQTVTVDHILPGSATRVEGTQRRSYPDHADLFALYDLAHDMLKDAKSDEEYRAIYKFAYDIMIPISNPQIRWPGTGGYWCGVDINDILGLKPKKVVDIDDLNALIAQFRQPEATTPAP